MSLRFAAIGMLICRFVRFPESIRAILTYTIEQSVALAQAQSQFRQRDYNATLRVDNQHSHNQASTKKSLTVGTTRLRR